jgi:A/G-specific adenine glycosylase
VLVSEFMLQQTTVAAVIPYFVRWMQRFPDIATLAAAPESDVLKLWEGLGYYSRARNLHRAAQSVTAQCGGKIPSDFPSLRSLPGIGPYTAAAIAAFAFDQCVPVLDANINRVVARLFNYRENITTKAGRDFLELAAASLLPKSGGRRHASVLMDLGATVCRSGEPNCTACPVHHFCKAVDPAQLPVKPPKKAITEITDWRSFSLTDDSIFLIESPGPTWRGLWILPPGEPTPDPLATLVYSITRYKVTLRISLIVPHPNWTPFPLSNLPPMPSPHRKALRLILAKKHPDA